MNTVYFPWCSATILLHFLLPKWPKTSTLKFVIIIQKHIITCYLYIYMSIKMHILGTSLVAQWLRIRLPMQRTRVRSRGATKPMCQNYWACALEPTNHNYWARMPQILKPVCLEPVLCNKRSHRNEKLAFSNEDPMQP